MGNRSLILLDDFESNKELKDINKFYTTEFNESQLPEIIMEIKNNDKYIFSLER